MPESYAADPFMSTTGVTYTRKNPCLARLKHTEILTKSGSEKDTRHFEIDLGNSGLTYEPGDSLAVLPQNDPELVEKQHRLATPNRSIIRQIRASW